MDASNHFFVMGSLIKNRYELVQFLARGGMGRTFLALDQLSGKQCVLKILAFEDMENWSKLDLFEREIKTLQNMEHPHIPKYIEHFEYEAEGKTFYILVQEFVNGKTLKTLIEEGKRFGLEEVQAIFKTLLEILAYIHELQPALIHRDINPKNIILSNTGQVYLVDFGAVGQVVKDTVMGGNTMVGTMGYMPQEQLYGKALPASDLYALALTVIYLLTGKEPSSFDFKSMKPDFHPFVNIPEELEKLLDKMIEADLKNRPQSARVVLSVLEGKGSLVDYQALLEQIPEDVKVVEQNQTRIVSIPNKGPLRFLAIFLLFFSVAWNSIIIFAASQIPAEAFFVYLFLIPFFSVGIGLPIASLYIFFGRTRFYLSPKAFTLSKVLFGFRLRSKSIPLSEITGVELQDATNAQDNRTQILLIRGKRSSIRYLNQNILWFDARPLKLLFELYLKENRA